MLLIIESIVLVYYYHKFGHVEMIEKILFLFSIIIVWFLGKNHHEIKFYAKKANEKENELQEIFDNTDVAIWSFDVDSHTELVSAGIEKIYGLPRQRFQEDPFSWLELVHPEDMHLIKERTKKLYAGEATTTIYRIMKRGSEICWLKDQGTPIMNSSGRVVKINGVVSDVTDLKKSEEKNEYLAYYDTLTGLPNRNMLDEFNEMLIEFEGKAQNIGVIFLDLDFFKMLNDTLGHSIGDIVLQNVSEKLNKYLQKDDILFKYGGDEFIILLKGAGRERALEISAEILEEIACPIYVKDYEIFLSASAGISIYPVHGKDMETLAKCAETAMHFAREKGRGNCQLYDPAQGKHVEKKMILANGLRKALAKDEFFIQYQPQFNINTGEIIGVEALIRWNHPEIGFVSPAEFIPVAEETGIIVDIGKWVLNTACMQNKLWQEEGLPCVNMAVNVSVKQFQDKGFMSCVRNVLNDTKLDPKYLELEMTESIMENSEYLHKVLNELRAMGIKLSMDDFGTGYSSLSLLRHLPLDRLKIDRSFVEGIQSDKNAVSIIKTIIDMGVNLNMDIIAEGVENEEQVKFLRRNKCSLVQGYLFSRPIPAEKVGELLKKADMETYTAI